MSDSPSVSPDSSVKLSEFSGTTTSVGANFEQDLDVDAVTNKVQEAVIQEIYNHASLLELPITSLLTTQGNNEIEYGKGQGSEGTLIKHVSYKDRPQVSTKENNIPSVKKLIPLC